MKRFIFSVALLFVAFATKAQHIELSYPTSSPPSDYCTTPYVWLDGDSVRFSMTVTFPPITVILDDHVDVWLGCGDGPLTYDLSWTNANRPSDTERVYSGAKYIGDLLDGEGLDVDYGVQFETLDFQVLGINSMVSFRYYSY